jgi:hypothetical protein
VESSINSKKGAADCALCLDSIFALKEQTLMLNNMELIERNDSDNTTPMSRNW